jgi:hypothetical protein
MIVLFQIRAADSSLMSYNRLSASHSLMLLEVKCFLCGHTQEVVTVLICPSPGSVGWGKQTKKSLTLLAGVPSRARHLIKISHFIICALLFAVLKEASSSRYLFSAQFEQVAVVYRAMKNNLK